MALLPPLLKLVLMVSMDLLVMLVELRFGGRYSLMNSGSLWVQTDERRPKGSVRILTLPKLPTLLVLPNLANFTRSTQGGVYGAKPTYSGYALTLQTTNAQQEL